MACSCSTPLHVLLVSPLLWFCPASWPYSWSWDAPGSYLPQGVCTCSFSLELPSSRSSHASSLTSVRFLLQCHLFHQRFPDYPLETQLSHPLQFSSLQGSPLSAITPHVTSAPVSALETSASLFFFAVLPGPRTLLITTCSKNTCGMNDWLDEVHWESPSSELASLQTSGWPVLPCLYFDSVTISGISSFSRMAFISILSIDYHIYASGSHWSFKSWSP